MGRKVAKPLVGLVVSDHTPPPPRAPHAVLPCWAAVVAPHPELHSRPAASAPPGDRLTGRCPNPTTQALLVLVHLRKGETFAELAAGFDISVSTAWRYVQETVELLAARAPTLVQAISGARRAGLAYVVLDGTLIATDRLAADRLYYSGKHRRHEVNLQVIASATGELLWVSGPLPGRVHDTRAARIWGVLRLLEASGLVVLADKGYHGASPQLLTPAVSVDQCINLSAKVSVDLAGRQEAVAASGAVVEFGRNGVEVGLGGFPEVMALGQVLAQ